MSYCILKCSKQIGKSRALSTALRSTFRLFFNNCFSPSDWIHQNQQFMLSLAFEPPHDKTNKMTVRPAKTQISLGIRPVWSSSSLCTQWVDKDPSFLHADPSFLHADSEDSDQSGWMPRLIWVFAGTCHFVGFVMRQLTWHSDSLKKFTAICVKLYKQNLYNLNDFFCGHHTVACFIQTISASFNIISIGYRKKRGFSTSFGMCE